MGWSRSRKTNVLLNLIKRQSESDKIVLYAKDPYKPKYQYLIKTCEVVGLNHCNDPKTFLKYSNDMKDNYNSIEEYNPGKKKKY